MCFFIILLVDKRILIRIRIQEAQKHTDPVPDHEHRSICYKKGTEESAQQQ
jgi:hypothetical protein